jgi:hypothetical protein
MVDAVMNKANSQVDKANYLFNSMLKYTRGTYYVRELNQYKKNYDELAKKFELSEEKCRTLYSGLKELQ